MRESNWTQSNPFRDVMLENWFNNAVSTMTNIGIFHGVSDDTFAPNRPVTRGEMAAIIVRFMNLSENIVLADNYFDDIAGHWAQGYINTAAANGWAQGAHGHDGAFYPNQPITRAEAAAMVNRIFNRLPETTADLLPDMLTWSDNGNVNAWYYLYIQSASNSYTFERKEDGIHENWLAIMPPRNWTLLERPESTPNCIF
jgi:hypothetical protein